jgi:mannose-6-phosphate isomerase
VKIYGHERSFRGRCADVGCHSLYPLRFEPIFQYRLWGGRRLEAWLDTKLPGDGPIGEAWLLSDRDDFPSRVADGPLKGQTLAELIERSPNLMLGELASRYRKFPLLLKLLDVQKMLSVQVHPPDDRADLIPAGETGKTEAWVVLEARPGGRVYAGLKAGTTANDLRALSEERGRLPARFHARFLGRAYLSRLARFILWAVASSCSRFSKTAT